jgi:cysteine-rich repeat protein
MTAACGDDTGTGGSGGGTTGSTGGSGGATTTTTSSGGASTGGSSTGGSGTGGSPMADFTDACPPNAITLNVGQSTVLTGTTTGQSDDFMSFCADTTAAADQDDVVIQVDIVGTCTLTTTLDEQGNFDGAISVHQQSCATRAGGDHCSNGATAGETYKDQFTTGTYYFVIDAADGNAGDFTLSLDCATPACGDGVVNAGEECDPGSNTPNDGCGDPGAGNACKVETAIGAADTCATIGTPIQVAQNATVLLPSNPPPLFNNAVGADNYEPIDLMPTGATCYHEPGGKDQVFAVQALAAGTLTVHLEGADGQPPCVDFSEATCVDRVLYIRTGMCDTGTQVACEGTTQDPTGYSLTATTTVTANETVYVFVDGYDGMSYSEGPYALRLSLAP